MGISVLNTVEDIRTVINDKNKLVIIDCGAEWCGPCRQFGKKYNEYVDEYKGTNVVFCSLDCDNKDLSDFVAENAITALPTILFLRGDDVVDKIIGADFNKFVQYVEKYTPSTQTTSNVRRQ